MSGTKRLGVERRLKQLSSRTGLSQSQRFENNTSGFNARFEIQYPVSGDDVWCPCARMKIYISSGFKISLTAFFYARPETLALFDFWYLYAATCGL
jgi:hypothetical protein